MADPFRLRLMKALTAALSEITTDNGFQFDLQPYADEHGRPRDRVYRGRDIFGATDPLPLLSVLEDPRTEQSDNGSDGRVAINKMRVIIQGFLAEDETGHPLDQAYRLSGDVIRRLVAAKAPHPSGILGMGRQLMAMSIGQPVHRPGGDNVSDTAHMLVGVTFTLAENIEKPYDGGV